MKKTTAMLVGLLMGVITIHAQETPTISPTATYTNTKGESEESTEYSGSAPIQGRFEAHPENVGSWSEYYEWRFNLEGEASDEPYLIRYEQDTEYTFTKAGSHRIVCYAVFTQGKDTIAYTQEYWNEIGALRITISESKLDMPNAFSPNNDGINDVYKAKDGHQSLLDFHAIIFNRWGQKIYEWDDPDGGWDGTWNGHDVKEGVYFVDVRAKGADGRNYHIKRDVNLLRGFRERESGTTTP